MKKRLLSCILLFVMLCPSTGRTEQARPMEPRDLLPARTNAVSNLMPNPQPDLAALSDKMPTSVRVDPVASLSQPATTPQPETKPQPATAPSTIPASQTQPAESQPTKIFRIGYLPTGDGGMTEPLAHDLEQWLEDNRNLRNALRASGFSGEITIQPADGHNDLRNRLANRQLELAFSPAIVFASLPKSYRVIFQEKRPGDIWDTRGGGQILRQGAVFVGPRSPLFNLEMATSATLRQVRQALSTTEIAVPSAYDAAGFQYPLLAMIGQLYVEPQAVQLRFCGSSQEVVKQVLSGMADIGACDRAVLETWLPKVLPQSIQEVGGAIPEHIVHILPVNIPPVPSDPVIILDKFHPEVSELGQVIKRELPKFFRSAEDSPFTLESRARDQFYDRLSADLKLLDSLMQSREYQP